MSLQLACVEQFHEQGHGAADLALALLVAADGPQVLDTQDGSKRGLCEPAPLSDGLEGGGVHLIRFRIRADVQERHLVARRERAAIAKSGQFLDGADPKDEAGGVFADFVKCLGRHLHSPVSGGAAPRCDEAYIGPMVLRCNNNRKHNRTRFVAFSERRGE